MTPDPSIAIPFFLRPARPEDEALLFQLFAESQWQLEMLRANEALWRSLIDMQYRGRKMTYDQIYASAEDSILCVRNNAGETAGAGRILVDKQPGCWRIVDIAVLGVLRGKGLGTFALQGCMEEAAAAGARLELRVTPGNPARLLYERLGFTVVREDAMDIEMAWNPGSADPAAG
jgi:ribosomal protein S18 acetylase RimI-like enzyme